MSSPFEHDTDDGPCSCGAWHKPGEHRAGDPVVTMRARVLMATNAALADAVLAEARTEGARDELALVLRWLEAHPSATANDARIALGCFGEHRKDTT